MSKGYYDIYCDESAIDGGGSFYFGGLYCTSIRADILRKKLNEVRLKHHCTGEMKWTKVSVKMLHVYVDFVDVFINDPYSKFYVLEVKRDINWRTWAPSEEERFFKAYYVFLRRLMNSFCRYGIYLDYKNGKWYRWSSLHFAMKARSVAAERKPTACYAANSQPLCFWVSMYFFTAASEMCPTLP